MDLFLLPLGNMLTDTALNASQTTGLPRHLTHIGLHMLRCGCYVLCGLSRTPNTDAHWRPPPRNSYRIKRRGPATNVLTHGLKLLDTSQTLTSEDEAKFTTGQTQTSDILEAQES